MATNLDPLGAPALAKAERYMRALRRAILTYWYATIEDPQAALIEAANAAVIVNILDEAVFQAELGDLYKTLRLNSTGGQVVTGLELVRNCETHAPTSFDGLLVETRRLGVPLAAGGQVMRTVWQWAEYDALPNDYVELQGEASEGQRRARAEAQHGYRRGLQGRSVVETMFDAESFFSMVDPRLAGTLKTPVSYPYAEVPEGEGTVLHRPLEHFVGNAPLPDMANRWDERVSASAPPADRYVKSLATSRRRPPPTASKRTITHRITEDGRVVGYSGHFALDEWTDYNWVERSAQIGRDLRAGYAYVVERDGQEVQVTSDENLRLAASAGAEDILPDLPEADEARGLGRLQLVETYPDLYVSMRHLS